MIRTVWCGQKAGFAVCMTTGAPQIDRRWRRLVVTSLTTWFIGRGGEEMMMTAAAVIHLGMISVMKHDREIQMLQTVQKKNGLGLQRRGDRRCPFGKSNVKNHDYNTLQKILHAISSS
ncbi:MAG: hypothetical protein ACWGOX_04690 [Desulforhopalus sp.]